MNNMEFNYKGIFKNYKDIVLENLIGINQFDNASLSIAAIELITRKGFKINEKHIYDGIRKARWPGRFEIIRKTPPFIIDGAHNPQGIESLIKKFGRFLPWTEV